MELHSAEDLASKESKDQVAGDIYQQSFLAKEDSVGHGAVLRPGYGRIYRQLSCLESSEHHLSEFRRKDMASPLPSLYRLPTIDEVGAIMDTLKTLLQPARILVKP